MANLNNEKVKANVKHQKRKQEMRNPLEKKRKEKPNNNNDKYTYLPTYQQIKKYENK